MLPKNHSIKGWDFHSKQDNFYLTPYLHLREPFECLTAIVLWREDCHHIPFNQSEMHDCTPITVSAKDYLEKAIPTFTLQPIHP
ncbi:hypothetical protein CEXT_628271 [Caerostris extrusa]|uniref:Uncharacterized protein n=1 Tax=Caerostris extrusa TaxID=172846 RepID=A0AAV4W942_CAEEX|nr:hypothetical protein CEXT_628271 [Caerostris extrusa]